MTDLLLGERVGTRDTARAAWSVRRARRCFLSTLVKWERSAFPKAVEVIIKYRVTAGLFRGRPRDFPAGCDPCYKG